MLEKTKHEPSEVGVSWQDSQVLGPEPSREHHQNTGVVISLLVFLWGSIVALGVDSVGVIFIYPGAPGLIHYSYPGLPLKPVLLPVLMLVSYHRSKRQFLFDLLQNVHCHVPVCSLNQLKKSIQLPIFVLLRMSPQDLFWIKDFNFTSYKETGGNIETPNIREATEVWEF